ncbi:hypothetical protein FNV43_RR06341 [Rhamnella rubrinervis]|uniref:Protein kinase domain-containing protein n=1 Tax=Rhamnella rubrinervis TaxID=2594499 RepID=A0A8K0ML75_9ROSA|nr:hypothetical protein FNV43_RR06341 [Rhamnella rubrinervis]
MCPGECENLPGTWNCTSRPKEYINNAIACNKLNITPGHHSYADSKHAGVDIVYVVAAISPIWWGMKKRKIFSAGALKKATNNYHESRVLGQGGYGIVYKGILPTNNKVVAIKKSKLGAQRINEQFINEVVMLLQINHSNVKLLDCCLQTEGPLLLYEFISNGTLFENIHKKGQGYSPLSWQLRLKIATDTASALAYLHSATSTPIIHRDVKTGNILLVESSQQKFRTLELHEGCLWIKSQDRPNMKDVAMELEGVLRSIMEEYEWGKVYGYTEETEYFLTMEPLDPDAIDVSGSMFSGR